MAKWIHNISGEEKTYHNAAIADDEFYQIPSNLEGEYASSAILLADLATGDAKMSTNGTSDMSGTPSQHIDFLKGAVATEVKITAVAAGQLPFAAKVLPDGKKLYTRVHGVSSSVAGAPDNIDFLVPYNNCKLTGLEIINGELGDKVNLKILDTPTGTISGTPYAVLNQFGYNVCIASNYYERESPYDADLIKDLTIRLEYDAINTDLLPKTVYVNFVLHEVKP